MVTEQTDNNLSWIKSWGQTKLITLIFMSHIPLTYLGSYDFRDHEIVDSIVELND